ncbi:MAG: sigma-54-dependent Fis family transcriptional regulator [Rhodanobacteraceae bacterium]|nr:sigma-54-dependent Fis family transcriptional regulator [Rhodanobacteraceae bacterium]
MNDRLRSLLSPATVLIVEDSDSLRALYRAYLRDQPWQTSSVGSAADAIAAISEAAPTLVLLDLQLPDANDLELLTALSAQAPDIVVVVATGHGSVDLAVEAIRLGAIDFLEKPVSKDRLTQTLRNALERLMLQRQVDTLMGAGIRERFHGFIGKSLAMQAVYRTIAAAAPSKATVFITGESGTGKEVTARAIHAESPRREGPFVALNCAAIPRDLIESELFGHQKGAFTGAQQAREGAAEQAHGGTLFLDEIGEMNLDLQSKLLRFLQTGVVKRLGANQERQVDVRFLCATNRDPWMEVQAGRFREDLYFRLHVIPLHLPPLREREDDVLLLAEELLQRFAREESKRFNGFSQDARGAMLRHPWLGNVRELENVIRHAVVLNASGELGPAQLRLEARQSPRLPPAAQAVPAPGSPVAPAVAPQGTIEPLASIERRTIEHAIAVCKGNIPEAARRLEVAPSTIYRKLAQWGAG